jgi:hypothetical protein
VTLRFDFVAAASTRDVPSPLRKSNQRALKMKVANP